jgi:transposase
MLHEPLRFSPQQFARKIEKVTGSPERASFFEKESRRMKTRAAASTWRDCDHLPLCRQSQIFARHGVDIDRSTLANWVGGACWWLEPLQARLPAHVFGSTKLFADDTPIRVLDPGRGRTKTGRLWVYARNDRPWSGPEPPAAIYFYSPDRKAERPAAHLQDFRGVLQVDRYAGFERLTAPGDIVLEACWAHARRKFYDLHEATGSPIAAEALRRIAELYR